VIGDPSGNEAGEHGALLDRE